MVWVRDLNRSSTDVTRRDAVEDDSEEMKGTVGTGVCVYG